MSDGYEITSLDEIEIPGLVNTARSASIRRHFGIESFGVNAWSADAGDDVIGEHDEVSGGAAQHEELYVVLSGKATFTADGQTVDGPAGTIVFVRDPTVKRKAVADEAGTRILAVGAKRGEAFVPSPWERSAPSFPSSRRRNTTRRSRCSPRRTPSFRTTQPSSTTSPAPRA